MKRFSWFDILILPIKKRKQEGFTMKSKFSNVSLCLALCIIISMFTGCSSSKTESAASTSTTPTTTSSTTVAPTDSIAGQSLVIWEHTPQFEAPLKAVINAFNAKNPDVKVEYQIKTSDSYYNLLATTIQAGEAPDLFWTNGTATTNLSAYVKQNVIMDITDKVDLSLFSDTTKEIVTIDGRQYASPTAEVGGRAVFYNKDIFTKLGLKVPTNFSEFEASLATIKKADIIPISFSGFDPWAILFHFEPVLAAMSLDWLEESKTQEVKVNDPRVVAAYDKMLEWADKGYYGTGFVGVDEGGALLAFSKGKAAMCIEGTWNIQTIQENNPELNFGAFQLPCEDGKRPFVGTSSCGFSISKDTESPEAALAFLNFFASVEGQTLWINALDAIPGVKQIVSKNTIINEIAQYDIQTASYYDILGKLQAEGQNPRKVWEEDQTKVMSKGITTKAFVDTLESMTK